MIGGDSALRESIVGMLKRIGYIADAAANGEEAIERLPRYTYDVILCALRMPAMKISPAYARREYGVAIDERTWKVAPEETARLRAAAAQTSR